MLLLARPGPRGGPQASASPPPVARRFPATVPGDAASMLQKREKVLLLRTFQGRTLRIVREHYLRPSVSCNSPLCPQPAACHNGQSRGGPGRPGREERGRPGSEREAGAGGAREAGAGGAREAGTGEGSRGSKSEGGRSRKGKPGLEERGRPEREREAGARRAKEAGAGGAREA